MVTTHSKQVSMPAGLLDRLDAIATKHRRNRSQLIGASIDHFMASSPDVEAAITDAAAAQRGESVRVTFSVQKDLWKDFSGAADAAGRERALLVRIAVERFLKLPAADQKRAILRYVT